MPRPSLLSLGAPALATYGAVNVVTYSLSLAALKLSPVSTSLSLSLSAAGSTVGSTLGTSLAPTLFSRYAASLSQAVTQTLSTENSKKALKIDSFDPVSTTFPTSAEYASYFGKLRHVLLSHTDSTSPCLSQTGTSDDVALVGVPNNDGWCQLGEGVIDGGALHLPLGHLLLFAYVVNATLEPARIWLVYALMARRIKRMREREGEGEGVKKEE